mgnify:CR=1 FL=1
MKPYFEDDAVTTIIPEGAEIVAIKVLCERFGYGRVMQVASDLWQSKDPIGALVVGPCAAYAICRCGHDTWAHDEESGDSCLLCQCREFALRGVLR